MDDNQCRVQGSGLKNEGAATNMFVRSQQLNNAAWQVFSFNGPVDPVVTADTAVAPDGTTTAETVALDATVDQGVAGDCENILQIVPLSDATIYTLSAYVKGVSGSGTTYLFFNMDATTYRTGVCAYNSTTWTRCTATGITTATTDYAVHIGVDAGG
jgi:hypothetical protein